MKKSLLLWGIGLILILVAGYVINNHQLVEPAIVAAPPLEESGQASVDAPVIQEREQAVDFTVTDLQGNAVSLSDFKGQNVYINFWATWCKWCVYEMPDLEKVYKAYKDQNIVLLAISVGEERDKVVHYIEENNYTFGIFLDPDKVVTKAYGLRSIPVSIFIDKNGNIAHQRVGAMKEEQMKSIIDELLAEQ